MDNNLSIDNRLSSTILQTIGAVVCVMNTDGEVILFNKACQKLTGYTENEALGRPPWEFLIEDTEVERVKEVFGSLRLGNFPNQNVNYWVTRSGEKRLISWSNTALGNTEGHIDYIIATGIDITDRKAAEDELAKHNRQLEKIVSTRTRELQQANRKLELLAYQDKLTGIFNRHYLDNSLQNELQRARRNKSPLSLIICDVDHFKEYNDAYGHVAGDKCLKELANLLETHFQRASDLVARYGGEEFCIVLPNTAADEAERLAEQLRKSICKLDIAHGSSPVAGHVTVSIGVLSCVPGDNCTPDAIIHTADMALYKSKENGRNQITICTEAS
jgi:diguanylate cyclase (GGDEF)-like protein/PAS domain S-box-containing protein